MTNLLVVLRVVELLEMGFRFWRKNEVDELCNDVKWKWHRIRIQLEFGTVSQRRDALTAAFIRKFRTSDCPPVTSTEFPGESVNQ